MPWIQNYRRIGLYFYAYCSYTEAVNKIRRWISMTNWKGWWRKAYVLVQRNYIHRIPVILHENLQCESHKPYCPRNSVSHCSRYVNREMPVPQALRLQTPLIYVHTTSRILSMCDISLGSLKLPAPEAGDIVELLLLKYSGFSHGRSKKN